MSDKVQKAFQRRMTKLGLVYVSGWILKGDVDAFSALIDRAEKQREQMEEERDDA